MKSSTSLVAALLLLAGCASAPTGPSVMALPGTGKTFDQFRNDDADCRQYAQNQIGGEQAAVDAGVRSAAVGTAVGAVAGALVGGHEGAGAGAGAGLVVGSMAGAGAAQGSAYGTQRHYDIAYVQCMYAKGDRVPVPAGMIHAPAPAERAGPEPAGATYPPPPPPAR